MKVVFFSRLPLSFAKYDDICDGVRKLMFNTSGGRVRFQTDSKVIAIKAEMGEICHMNHMSDTGIRGFDLYAAPAGKTEDIFFKKTMISTDSFYNISYEFDDCFLRDITINFPLYNDVKSLCIGLERDSVLTRCRRGSCLCLFR